jgi:hypothetical protein
MSIKLLLLTGLLLGCELVLVELLNAEVLVLDLKKAIADMIAALCLTLS